MLNWQPPIKERVYEYISKNPQCTKIDIIANVKGPERIIRLNLRVLEKQKYIKSKIKKGFRSKNYELFRR